MEAQRSRLHLLNTVQEILVGIGAYPRVVADIKAEVERRNIFWSPKAHKVHLHWLILVSWLIGCENEISIQDQRAREKALA